MHNRSNLQKFTVAAEQILYYLGSLLNNEPDFYADRLGELRGILRAGFQKTPGGSTDQRKWTEAYRNGNYHYNKNDYWESQLGDFRMVTIPANTTDIPQAFLDNFEKDEVGNYTAVIYTSASDDFFNYNLIAKAIIIYELIPFGCQFLSFQFSTHSTYV